MSNQQRVKVTVLGATGGIGQPLSLLLKLNPYITHLSLYDVVNVEGVAADLSHIDTDVIISYHSKSKDDLNNDSLKNALLDSNFVLIPAGIPRKPGMTRDDLFKINASICSELAVSIAINCPDAFTMVISNPVNSTVAIFQEIFKKYNVLNPNKLCGITELDQVRANTFLSQLTVDKLPNHFNVKVVGGHSGETIVPLFSQVNGIPDEILNNNDVLDSLIHRVQYGGDEVVEAKKGTGSSTLSMAYAANKFFNAVLMGYLGLKNIQMSSLICLDDSIDGVKEFKEVLSLSNKGITIPEFFSIPVNFGEKGVESVNYDWVNKMTDREKEMINIACQGLSDSVNKGQSFVRGN